MRDKPILHWRTLAYLLSQSRKSLPANFQSAIASQTTVLVTDVSKWQSIIDFVKMKRNGISGTFIKAGQWNYADPMFAANWREAKLAGMPRGTYWFFDSREAPKLQAKKWAELIHTDPGELMHMADFEESYGGSYGGWQNFKTFLTEFQSLSGLPNNRIGIYTGYYYWIGKVPLSEMDWFGKYNLWLASYNPPANVVIPRPWNQGSVIFWQYTSSGDGFFYGVTSKEIDMNYFVNGDLSQFNLRFGLSSGGGNTVMENYKVTASALNIRSGPGAGFPICAEALAINDLVWGTPDPVTGWVHIQQVRRGTSAVASLDGWCSGVYLLKVDSTSPLPVLNVTVSGDGYESVTVELRPIE